MPLKQHGKRFARTLLHRAGWLRGVRYWNRDKVRILMYHDFPSTPGLQEALAKQCAYIARYYQVVSLTDIGRFLREGKSLPPNALAVTVDDGNRDFFLNGYPVFRAYKIPVTVFLVSGFIDGQLWFWWDKISYVIENSRRPSFELPLYPGGTPVLFPLETLEQRRRAISTITTAMKELNVEERAEVLNGGLSKRLGVELPNEAPSHMAPMSWPEVRNLAENGIDIGAHTVTHPVLSRIVDQEKLVQEIEGSKKRIEEELHRSISHFCYPYGCWEDFNDQTLKVLDECHFQTAVTAQHGMNFRETHPYRLTRLSMDAGLPEFYFRERLAGLHAG